MTDRTWTVTRVTSSTHPERTVDGQRILGPPVHEVTLTDQWTDLTIPWTDPLPALSARYTLTLTPVPE